MFLETSSFRGIIFSTQNVMNGNLFVRSFQTNSKDKDIHEKTQMVFWDAQKTTMRCQFSQVSHGHENEAIPNGEGLCFFREGDGLDKIVRLLATILVHKYDAASYIYIYICSYMFFVHGSLMHLIVQTWAFPPQAAISIVVNHRPNAASFWLIFDGS